MLKKYCFKCLLFLPVILLGVGVSILIFNNSNVQLLDKDINIADDCELNKQILYNEPAYDNPPNNSWRIRPLDIEFSTNVNIRFIERVQYYVVEERQIIVNDYIHTHEHVWFRDGIYYEIVNTSDFHYSFGQIHRVAKLIDGEWYDLYDYMVAVLGWLGHVPPNETIEWREGSMVGFPEDYVFDNGVYKLIKPIWRGYYPNDTQEWAYLLVHLD